MKKSIIILLILSNLFSTVGFSMNIHECGGNKSFLIYGLSFGKKCLCEHKNQYRKCSCCKDKKVEVKSIKKDTTLNNTKITFKHELIDFNVTNHFTLNKILSKENTFFVIRPKHPPDIHQELNIMFNVFRI